MVIPVLSLEALQSADVKREWQGAVDEAARRGPDTGFILPVALADALPVADLPEAFARRHWERAPEGHISERFVFEARELVKTFEEQRRRRETRPHTTESVEEADRDPATMPPGRLTPALWHQLADALTDAFPSRRDLAVLMKVGLGRDLDAISDRSNPLNQVVSDVIRWAESDGSVDDLIAGALEARPESRAFREFAASWERTQSTRQPPR